MYKIEKTFNVLEGTVPDFRNKKTFSEYLISKATEVKDGENGLMKLEHEETTQTPALDDYRYIGANPNNYICLEENGTCTEDQLYRIIGVIPTQKEENGKYELRVKLIKHTNYISKSYWCDNNLNDWIQSSLNNAILNKNYYESIVEYHKYIDVAKWYLGSVTPSNFDNMYADERGNTTRSSEKNTIRAIGMIYVSDYGLATSGGANLTKEFCVSDTSSSWTSWNRSYIQCRNNDWLYKTTNYWSIDAYSGNTLYVWAIGSYDPYSNSGVFVSYTSHDVYPSFYLKYNIFYMKGSGTQEEPYVITEQ